MKYIYIILFTVIFTIGFSQQQFGNVFLVANTNAPVQMLQTNLINNASNFNNNDNYNVNNPIQQQYINLDNNVVNAIQLEQLSNRPKQNNSGNKFNLSLGFSSRSTSSSSSSKKTHKHTFHKKLNKFNRNFYGKITSHKKSKHLVDVCFNWSK